MNVLLEDAKRQKRKDILFYAGLIVVTLLRLYFFGERGLVHTDSLHDDLLFLKQAHAIVHGEWLGNYNHLTLAKAPGYSLFCAFCLLTGLPYYLFFDILLCLSAGLCTLAVKPLLKTRSMIIFFYTFLILNPFVLFIQRLLIQEFFVIPLWLLIFSMSAILLRVFLKDSSRNILFWSFCAGFSLLACGLLREEGKLLLLIYLAFVLFILFLHICNKRKWLKTPLILLLPFAIEFSGNGIIAAINDHYYGYFGVCERRDNNYKQAMGTILGIAHSMDPAWDPRIPVKYDILDKLYKVSPAMAELSTKSNLARGYFWTTWPNGRFPEEVLKKYPDLAGNIKGGFLQWAFLGAMEEAGHYKNRRSVDAFYKRLNEELAQGIRSGELVSKSGVRKSSLPPYDPQILSFFFQKLTRELPKILFWRPGLLHKVKPHTPESAILDTRRMFSFMNEDHATSPEYPTVEIYGWGYSAKGVPLSQADFQNQGGHVIFHAQARKDVAEFLGKQWNIPPEKLPAMGFHILVRGIPRFCVKDPVTGIPRKHIDYDTWSNGYIQPHCRVNIDSKKELPPPPVNLVPVFKRRVINLYLVNLSKLSPYFFLCILLTFALTGYGLRKKIFKKLFLSREGCRILLLLLFSGMALFYFLTIIMANVYLHCPRYPHYYIPSSSVYWALIGFSLVLLFQKGKEGLSIIFRKREKQ